MGGSRWDCPICMDAWLQPSSLLARLLRTAGERHTSHQPAPHTTTTTTLPQYFFKGFDAAGEGEEGEWDDGSEYDEEDNEEAIIFGYLDEGDLMERFKQAKGE